MERGDEAAGMPKTLIDPAAGDSLVSDADEDRHDPRAQTRTILTEIRSYLEGEGRTMDDVVRVRVYVEEPHLTDESLAAIHDLCNDFFTGSKPASTPVEVAGLVRENCVVEIDADAVIPDDGWE